MFVINLIIIDFINVSEHVTFTAGREASADYISAFRIINPKTRLNSTLIKTLETCFVFAKVYQGIADVVVLSCQLIIGGKLRRNS